MIFFYGIFILANVIFSFFIIKKDIEERKILNKYLKIYFYFMLVFKVADFYFFPIVINKEFFIYYSTSIILPFLFYNIKLWGAGDSKLLTLLLISLPNILIKNFSYFYILKYLNFLFILSCLVYLILGIIKIIKFKNFYLKKDVIILQLKVLLIIILFLNIINSIIFIKLDLNIYFSIVINLGIVFILRKILYKINSKICLRILLFILILVNIKFINTHFLYRITYILFIFFIKEIIDFSEKKEVKVEDIKLGDIITQKTLAKFNISKVRGLPQQQENKNFILKTNEQLEAIKRWKNSKYGEDFVEVEKSIPFSIYICSCNILLIIYFLVIIKG